MVRVTRLVNIQDRVMVARLVHIHNRVRVTRLVNTQDRVWVARLVNIQDRVRIARLVNINDRVRVTGVLLEIIFVKEKFFTVICWGTTAKIPQPLFIFSFRPARISIRLLISSTRCLLGLQPGHIKLL